MQALRSLNRRAFALLLAGGRLGVLATLPLVSDIAGMSERTGRPPDPSAAQ
jgi:hypothetical protein